MKRSGTKSGDPDHGRDRVGDFFAGSGVPARFGWLLCALVGSLVYIPTLGGEFIYDDVMIIQYNDRIIRPEGPADYLLTSYWDDPGQGLEYRPLTMASFAIQYALSGPNPVGWKIVNVLLHGAVCAAGWFLIVALFGRGGLATAAMLLFAIHPIHIEAVAGIVGRAELLTALGMLVCCLAGVRLMRGGGGGRLALVSGGAAAALALGSKDSGVTLFPLLLTLPLFVRPADAADGTGLRYDPRAFRRLFPLLVCTAILVTVYLALRIRVLGGITGPPGEREANPYNNPLVIAEGISSPLSRLKVLGIYARMLIAPFGQSPDYSYDAVPLVRNFADPAWIPGALVLIGWIAGLRAARHRPAALFGLVFIPATFLVTSNLFILIGTMIGERLLYLPSLGFCILFADLVIAARDRIAGSKNRVLALRAGGGLLALWLLAITLQFFRYLPLWNDDKALFGYTVRRVPRSARALQMHAHDLLDANDLDGAMEYFARSIEILPLPMTLAQYGQGLMLQGRNAEAAECLRRALTGNPREPVAVSNLARILAGEGRWEEARALYGSFLAAGDLNFEVARDYGRFMQAWGSETGRADLLSEAVRALEPVARTHYSRDPQTLFALGRACAGLGRTEEARTYMLRVLELQPGNPDALQMLAEIEAAASPGR